MKALVLTSSTGEYDDYYTSVDAVYLVPDDFNAENDRAAFYLSLREARDPRFRWRKDGYPYQNGYTKVYALWIVDLTARFGETKMEVVEI